MLLDNRETQTIQILGAARNYLLETIRIPETFVKNFQSKIALVVCGGNRTTNQYQQTGFQLLMFSTEYVTLFDQLRFYPY